VCAVTAAKYHTHFIDITTMQRADGNRVEFLAADTLHPSGKEYSKWADTLAVQIMQYIVE
jgi:lysophospholipase L1-like esterase